MRKVVLGLVVALPLFWWLAASSPYKAPEIAATDGSSSAPQAEAGTARAPAVHSSTPTLAAASESPAAPPAKREAPSGATDHHHHLPSDVFPQRQGPVAELAQRFAGESRGPSSEANEARLAAPFAAVPTIAPELVPSFECRRSVCRAELRWDAHLGASYTAAIMRAVGKPAAPFGIDEAGPPDADGYRPVVLYIGLDAMTAPSPSGH